MANPMANLPSYIIGIDPGPVNCGVCLFDVKREVPIEMDVISFREKRKKTDKQSLGYSGIMEAVKEYVRPKVEKWMSSNTLVGVEDQVVGRMGGRKGKQHNVLNGETSCIQYAIQALVPSEMFATVSPSAVKNRYRDDFPIVGKDGDQYASDKKNAIINGRKYVPDKMMKALGKKKDDALDAFWICKYLNDLLKKKPTCAQKKKIDEKMKKAKDREKIRELKKIDNESRKTFSKLSDNKKKPVKYSKNRETQLNSLNTEKIEGHEMKENKINVKKKKETIRDYFETPTKKIKVEEVDYPKENHKTEKKIIYDEYGSPISCKQTKTHLREPTRDNNNHRYRVGSRRDERFEVF